MKSEKEEILEVLKKKEKSEFYLDKIRGSLIGGAVGDALGYSIEFLGENEIFSKYGENGIQNYELDSVTGKALISDDTQMTLFTANGILIAETRISMRGIGGIPHGYIHFSYQDWLRTQEMTYDESMKYRDGYSVRSWLNDVPELYARRAPGNTCLSAIKKWKYDKEFADIENPMNNSKGCGGIMRVAPLGLKDYGSIRDETFDYEGAEIAAITHGHSLGYMPAAVLVHIIRSIVYPRKNLTLKEIIIEARDTVKRVFSNDEHIDELTDIIDLAISLSENNDSDLENIHKLGEGWVAEETLAIAIYCSLRYQTDFSKGIITAVNHRGDSDSTGAVTGNILGALLGYDAIEDKWKDNLELREVILEMAEDLCHGCLMEDYSPYYDADWVRKYIYAKWK